MDITGPRPEEEVAPDPQLETERNVDQAALIRQTIEQHPAASADEIVERLSNTGLHISGIQVAAVLQKIRSNNDADQGNIEIRREP